MSDIKTSRVTYTKYGTTITTKFLSATGSRGPRIKASIVGVDYPSRTTGWDYELGVGSHGRAAQALAEAWANGLCKGADLRLIGGIVADGVYAWHVVFEG